MDDDGDLRGKADRGRCVRVAAAGCPRTHFTSHHTFRTQELRSHRLRGLVSLLGADRGP